MPIVEGIERFREAMQGFEDCYVLIGGSACSLLLDQQGVEFRQTRDLDIVVLTASADVAFARRFWTFVEDAGYLPGVRDDGQVLYYRFTLPEARTGTGYPAMIELFSKHPGFRLEHESSHIAPLPFDGNVSSLSAIILDDGYYEFIGNGLTRVNGISVVDSLHLMPLKMRAHLDLNARSARGEHVDKKDLRKHRADVLTLSETLPSNAKLVLAGRLAEDTQAFLDDAEEYVGRIPKARDRARAMENIAFLRAVYLG